MKKNKALLTRKPWILLTTALAFVTGSGFYTEHEQEILGSPILAAIEANELADAEVINEKPVALEVDEAPNAIAKILDTVLEDGYTEIAHATEMESSDLSKAKFSIDSLIVETENLDFNKLGEQEATVTIYNKGASNVDDSLVLETIETEPLKEMNTNIKHTFNVQVEIKDHKAPEITLVADEVLLDYEEEIVAEEWIDSIIDNVDGEIYDYEFDGSNIDVTTPGDYIATYTAKDSSGNKTVKEMIVTVDREPVAVAAFAGARTMGYVGSGNVGSISELGALINSQRAAWGLAPLTVDYGNLGSAAQVRAIEASGYLSHYRPNGTSYRTALNEYGVSYSASSEVLTYAGSTAADALNWWMSSPAHTAALMNGSFTRIGLGYYNGMWCGIPVR